MRILILIAVFAFPAVLQAKPWCLSTNCTFDTQQACESVAARRGGSCVPNPRELGVAGDAVFCVVTATKKECTYRNKRRCLDAALIQGGGCVRNTDRDLRQGSRRGKKYDAGDDFGALEDVPEY